MERSYESCVEILDRLLHILPAVFAAYGISEARSRDILENACRTAANHHRGMPAVGRGGEG
jgi:hypothetical protein